MRHTLPLIPLVLCGVAVAEDSATPEGWSHSGKLAALFSSVGTTSGDESRDPTIAGTTDAIAWKLDGTGRLMWKGGANEVQQDLKLAYGRQKQDEAAWTESSDEIRYDGIYRRVLSAPHFVYGSWGAETVFSGPEPEKDPLEPGRGWVSVGYGQKHENLFFTAADQTDRLEGRIGVRGSKRWGNTLTDEEKEFETGPEWLGRYEATIGKLIIGAMDSGSVKGFVQYEGWSEFSDLGHVTNLVTAGLFFQLTKYLTVDLNYRAYYEARPEDDEAEGAPGYSEWSTRHETLVGVTYLF